MFKLILAGAWLLGLLSFMAMSALFDIPDSGIQYPLAMDLAGYIFMFASGLMAGNYIYDGIQEVFLV